MAFYDCVRTLTIVGTCISSYNSELCGTYLIDMTTPVRESAMCHISMSRKRVMYRGLDVFKVTPILTNIPTSGGSKL